MPVKVGVGVSVSFPDGGSVAGAPAGRLQLTIASHMASIARNTLLLSIVSPYKVLSIELKASSIALWSDWIIFYVPA
jgi:hypothetical protein